MNNHNARFAWFALSLVGATGCAHPQSVTLTSAAAPAPKAPIASAPAAPPAPEDVAAADDNSSAAEAQAEEAKPEVKKPDGPMSFAQLTAALGEGGDKLALNVNGTTPAPEAKPISADGYSAVGAAHQAVDSWSAARSVGDIKVSGGVTTSAVRAGVQSGADRLRICYEHGLATNPRLTGRVVVSFSIDARGAVSSVDTQSDVIPSDVNACVRDAFSTMTFAAPKTAPAKIVYPIDFNKDS